MKLTGKAKELFRKWWVTQPKSHLDDTHCYLVYGNSVIVRLDSIPMMFQWGIYQDWADHIGYHMHVSKGIENDKFFWNINFKYGFEAGKYSLRQEARDAAIAKLNEIINNQ